MKTGIVVFGHGSSVAAANEAVRAIAAAAAAQGGWALHETAFLEAEPRLAEAVKKLAGAGVSEVVVLPYFLTLGIHLQRDLPRIVDDLAREFQIAIRVAPPLDGHPELSRILVQRAEAML
ncbi:MAG TPA: CbiX/SirB N-terminal domain-containing protein [Bryobacteraceae bacterium]|jgi:sirohydrochlorin ferrochelatase|nr:CbiX/SirB N-terminal domain-containing protein [Bryobacteraceae bacterium]